jgi:hypothetical protein
MHISITGHQSLVIYIMHPTSVGMRNLPSSLIDKMNALKGSSGKRSP